METVNIDTRRIAVCINGFIGNIKYNIYNFKSFFSNQNIDVFLHGWDTKNNIYTSDLVRQYNPIKFKVDNINTDGLSDISLYLKSMYISNSLKRKYEIENDFRYDIVVNYNFNLVFVSDEKFSPPNVLQRELYIKLNHINNDIYEPYSINDLFFFGDSHTMDIMALTYKTKFLYYEKNKDMYENILLESVISSQASLFRQAYRYGILLKPMEDLEIKYIKYI